MSRQKHDPWYGKLFPYAVGALIWMVLMALLYLYFWFTAPQELREEGKRSSQHLTVYLG